jgi:hypothetical protein
MLATYNETPTGKLKFDQPLKANGGSQLVRVSYGSHSDPFKKFNYILNYGKAVDVTLIKLFFFAKEDADVSKTPLRRYFFFGSDLKPLGTIVIPVVWCQTLHNYP